MAESPLPLNADWRYGSPTGCNDITSNLRPEPIYEMFRIPNAASYQAPKQVNTPR